VCVAWGEAAAQFCGARRRVRIRAYHDLRRLSPPTPEPLRFQRLPCAVWASTLWEQRACVLDTGSNRARPGAGARLWRSCASGVQCMAQLAVRLPRPPRLHIAACVCVRSPGWRVSARLGEHVRVAAHGTAVRGVYQRTIFAPRTFARGETPCLVLAKLAGLLPQPCAGPQIQRVSRYSAVGVQRFFVDTTNSTDNNKAQGGVHRTHRV